MRAAACLCDALQCQSTAWGPRRAEAAEDEVALLRAASEAQPRFPRTAMCGSVPRLRRSFSVTGPHGTRE